MRNSSNEGEAELLREYSEEGHMVLEKLVPVK
jgi:hypothetical protein